MIASVLVEIKAKSVDKAFDYKIPETKEEMEKVKKIVNEIIETRKE